MLKKITIFAICFSLFNIPSYALSLSSKSSIVICADTNQVLFGENIHEKMGMASTTKIMTAIIALEHGNMSDTVTVSQNASLQEGSSIYLKTGDKISLENLLYGLMLNSGNDAAMAIAEHISKNEEEFVSLMNKKAEELDLKNTHFENPSGLPDEHHYSTAYDMARLMSYAMQNDGFARIVMAKEHQITTQNAVTHLRNHNKLLWQYPYAIGGKTGYTKSCGRCFVSCAKKDNVTIIAVTLDAPDDWNDHKKLLDLGFEKAPLTSVISKNEIICTRVINGMRVNLLSSDNFSIPLKEGKRSRITCQIKLNDVLPKQINYATPVGIGKVYVEDFFVGNIELTSGQNIPQKTRFGILQTFLDILKKTLLIP